MEIVGLPMSPANLLRLISLAAIWGSAFLFMRIGAPVLGPAILVEFRVGLGALFFSLIGVLMKRKVSARENWKHYLILGFFNCALPFFLYSFAAKSLSASISSVINATSPIWAALIGSICTRQPLGLRFVAGLMLGMLGVCILVGFDRITLLPGAGLAIVAMLCGAISFGIAANYAKAAKSVEPFANGYGSLWAATLLLAPTIPFVSFYQSPTLSVMSAVLMLGILCSGVAYLLYFRLVQDLGATSALTVTFLVPVFGIFWGHIVLSEPIAWHTVVGSVIVVVGTALVTGFKYSTIQSLRQKRAS